MKASGSKTHEVWLICKTLRRKKVLLRAKHRILSHFMDKITHKKTTTHRNVNLNNFARATDVGKSFVPLTADCRRNKRSLPHSTQPKCVEGAVNFTGLTMQPRRQRQASLSASFPPRLSSDRRRRRQAASST